MGILSRRFKPSRASGSTRAPARLLLRRAAHGDKEAFLGLSEAYFNLVSEHLYLCNLDREDALTRAENIFREGWVRLPYMKRLADWERFLARSLVAVPVDAQRSTEGRRPRALVDLDAPTKFALTAFDLENWSYHWLARALESDERELAALLFDARCSLLSFETGSFPRKKRAFLQQVSLDLDGQVTPRQRQQILRKLCCSAEAKDFKSQWLDYRCHLIEMRQQVRLQPAERENFLRNVGARLSPTDMLRPPFFRRMKSLIGFSPDVPAPMVGGAHDLRFGGS